MTGNEQSNVLVITGPTASGKSGAALSVAEEFGGAVINADSMQVYRDLRILTARPSEADEVRVPHLLYGALAASERCTAVRWSEMALAAIEEQIGYGKLPILCGGTGLYLKALMEGLSPIPDIPDDVRDAVRARVKSEGTDGLHRELVALGDPIAARLMPADRQRVTRAFEVYKATGQSLAVWQALPSEGIAEHLQFHTILIDPPRDALYRSCDRRFAEMAGNGAIEEVRDLMALKLDQGLPVMKAVGVKELAGFLDGIQTLDDAIAASQRATRRLAKRQITWFSNQMIPNLHIKKQYSERILHEIFSFVLKKRLTGVR